MNCPRWIKSLLLKIEIFLECIVVCTSGKLFSFSTTVASGAELVPPRVNIASASPVITIPVMTNSPGALGGVFRTKVVLFNPTNFSFPVEVSFYGTSGFLTRTAIILAAGQIRNYVNFVDRTTKLL